MLLSGTCAEERTRNRFVVCSLENVRPPRLEGGSELLLLLRVETLQTAATFSTLPSGPQCRRHHVAAAKETR